MSNASVNNNNAIVSCIDGSSVSEAVCDYSSWIAAKVDAPLKLLHTIKHQNEAPVNDYSGAIGLGSREDLLEELTEVEQNRSRLLIEKGQIMLKAAKEKAIAHGVSSPELCQRHGSLVEALIDLEETIRVLVIGIRGESHEEPDSGISSKLESVIRSLHKPILVVNKSFTEPKTVMLAYDGSPACKKALDMMSSSPLFRNITCHVVHVGEKGNELLQEAADVLQAANIKTETVLLSGVLHEVLPEYQTQHGIDLMVMGAFSHTRVHGFLLGSFTAKMLNKTHKPLLLLR